MSDGSVLVVEIGAGRLSRVGDGRVVTTVAEVGGGPNGAAIGPDGCVYVCNNGGRPDSPNQKISPGIQRVDLSSGATEFIYRDCDGIPLGSPNDLVFDSGGNFWFTDYAKGSIYYATPDGLSIREVLSGLKTPNGIGLSPEEDILYWAQTCTRQVMRRRITRPGELQASVGCDIASCVRAGYVDRFTLLAGLPGAQELDSLAIDSTGAVCVGTLIESGITVISADGTSVDLFTLPADLSDPAVTNICFGGSDMKTAFITLTMTGRLIACHWSVPGLRLAFEDATRSSAV